MMKLFDTWKKKFIWSWFLLPIPIVLFMLANNILSKICFVVQFFLTLSAIITAYNGYKLEKQKENGKHV